MKCLAISSRSCRSYLLVCEKTKAAALVDPLLDIVETYQDVLVKEGLKLSCVIDTHTHADHLSAGAVLRERAPYAMHENSRSHSMTKKLADGETIGVGGFNIKSLHTPGHTADSLTLIAEDRILSGDFLFSGPDGAGRLDFPGSDPAAHFESLKKLDALPNGSLLYPGHEYSGKIGASLGDERKINPVLSPRTRDSYIRWWETRRGTPPVWMEQVVLANLGGALDPKAVAIPPEGPSCACVAGPSAHDAAIPQILPEDLARKLRRAPDSVALLDVREHEEYNDELGHVTGTVLIPVNELSQRLAEVPQGPLAVICRSGKRADRAAALLRESGRDEIWVLTGGMLAWNEARLPIVRN